MAYIRCVDERTAVNESIVTEKATDAADLPHVFRSKGSDVCEICKRSSEEELHSVEARERASEAAPAVITEKGTDI